ncbi:Hpt domain-containing protein [Breoghania corrubedonensis]|uniref:Hpt domain-containing protein n=1 Tax=Breoghania corrubedonensis TaxID=665038 RepID=A0A2T5UYH8_9HYPH|nr:Hpt domain-containing protein [Breoghania corrubedonensis]PTW56563.1 Hpt domain-containing protein [Breoghania corrubedonensis]
MEQIDQQKWDGLFEDLRTRYLKRLPERLDALKAARDAFKFGTTPELCERLALQTHKMVGSGKTYGFETISSRARIVEDLARQPSASIEDILPSVEALIDECRKVIRDSEPPQAPVLRDI